MTSSAPSRESATHPQNFAPASCNRNCPFFCFDYCIIYTVYYKVVKEATLEQLRNIVRLKQSTAEAVIRQRDTIDSVRKLRPTEVREEVLDRLRNLTQEDVNRIL
jgi:hypothetical protein